MLQWRANAWMRLRVFAIQDDVNPHILCTFIGTFSFDAVHTTLQPLYNTVRYNMVLDITRFKDGSHKCIDYIEK